MKPSQVRSHSSQYPFQATSLLGRASEVPARSVGAAPACRGSSDSCSRSSRSTMALLTSGPGKIPLLIKNIGDAAAHTGGEVAARANPARRRCRRSYIRSRGRPPPRQRRSRRSCGRRSAPRPRPGNNTSPDVAPYNATLPMMMFSSGTKEAVRRGDYG